MHALILCHGEPPSQARLHRHREQADVFIATDGAAEVALSKGERPDYVIGDLDSLSRSLEGVRVLHRPDQETNDLEKALDLALELGATSAIVLGASGKRLDHTWKNLSVLAAYHPRLNLTLEDEYGTLRLVSDWAQLEGKAGQAVSLLPLLGKADGITTVGLKYPLRDEYLENGVRDGTSNELLGEGGEVRLTRGILGVFLLHPQAVSLPTEPSVPDPKALDRRAAWGRS